MKVNRKVTKVYTLVCPSCNEGEFGITHLNDIPGNYGPWYCDTCGQAIKFTIEIDGSIDVEIVKGTLRLNRLTLLKISPKEKPVYFVVKEMDYSDEPRSFKDYKYTYESHACPISVMPDIQTIILGKDTDPHGLFEYVATVPNFDTSSYEELNDLFRGKLSKE